VNLEPMPLNEIDDLASALEQTLPAPHFNVDRTLAWLKLSMAVGIGPAHAHKLIAYFGDVENIFKANRTQIAQASNMRMADALLSVSESALKSAIAWASRANNRIITWEDKEYPQALLSIGDAPPLLYVKGDYSFLNKPAISIVGSRNCSSQGESNAEMFAKGLSQAGLTIVSGMAAGIDAAAHRGGMSGTGKTIAVIGTGIDRIYPARHVELAYEIANNGCIVSEFPIGTAPHPQNFPRRNRIISGLGQGVLVVEATPASGSLITARFAGEHGREVMAIPGSIHSPFSKGCHKLIREGAALVESVLDVIEAMGLDSPVPHQTGMDASIADDLSLLIAQSDVNDDSRLLTFLGHDPQSIDELCELTQIAPEVIAAQLLALELDGKVESLAGGKYQRKH
jgi:DNA processing protein